MASGKRTAVNLSSQVISFLINVCVSFFLTPFIVGKIGEDVYGFVGLANNVTSYVTVITIAINSLANRYITIAYVKNDIPLANKYYSSVTAANILVVLLFSLPAAILAAKLECFVKMPLESLWDIKLLWAFVFAVFFANLIFGQLGVAAFAKNRLELPAISGILSNVLKMVILLAFYLLLPARVSYIGLASLLCVIVTVALNYYYKQKLTPQLKISTQSIDFSKIKEIIADGIWNSINQLSQLLFTGLDLLLTNLFISVSAMGLLSIAKTVPVHLVSFLVTVAGVFHPAMTISYAKKSTDEFVEETCFALRMCGLICSVLTMGIIVFGRSFYSIWLPTLSEKDIELVQILSILTMLPQVFSIYVFPLYHVNTLTCKLKWPAIVSVALGGLNVVLVFLFLEYTSLDIYAIAGVSSVLQVLRVLVFVPMYAAANLKKSLFLFYPTLLKGIALNLVLLIVFGIIKRFINTSGVVGFIAAVAVSAIVGYAAGGVIMLKKSDRANVFKLIKGKLGNK